MDIIKEVNYPHSLQGYMDFLNDFKNELINKGAMGMLYK